MGEHFATIVHPDSRAVPEEAYRRISTPPFPDQSYRFFLQDIAGRPVPVEMRAVADVRDGTSSAGAHGIIRDLREQVRLEDDLRRGAADLASARERARLAQELHDSVTQALFSMTLTTRSVELLMERDPDAARQMLGELRELEREALAEMRALIFELRPANLEQDGLVQALRTHAAGIQGRVGLAVRVDCAVADDRAPLDVENALYRIAQEALHNVVKHAEATNVGDPAERLDAGRVPAVGPGRRPRVRPHRHPGRPRGHRGHASPCQPGRWLHRCHQRARRGQSGRGPRAVGTPGDGDASVEAAATVTRRGLSRKLWPSATSSDVGGSRHPPMRHGAPPGRSTVTG